MPRNEKVGILFLFIISIISVNIIAPIIMGLERGFSKAVYLDVIYVGNCCFISKIGCRTSCSKSAAKIRREDRSI